MIATAVAPLLKVTEEQCTIRQFKTINSQFTLRNTGCADGVKGRSMGLWGSGVVGTLPCYPTNLITIDIFGLLDTLKEPIITNRIYLSAFLSLICPF